MNNSRRSDNLTVIWLSLAALCLAIAGCADGTAQPAASDVTSTGSNASSKTADPPTAAAGTPVTAKVMSWDQTLELVGQQKGKIVVVDVWSTSCPPCMAEFPGLVDLHKKYGDDVTCISFNLDYMGDGEGPSAELQERVLKFLNDQQATCTNVISSVGDEDFYDSTKSASIPIVMVFGRNGKLVETFKHDSKKYGKAGFTYAKHISPLVDRLVSSPHSSLAN